MSELAIVRGDSYEGDRALQVTCVEADGTTELDLTGIDLAFMVKRRRGDADDDALITATIGSGITVADPTDGTAVIELDDVDTDDLPVGLFHWELQATDADGPITLASGRFRVTADLIREA